MSSRKSKSKSAAESVAFKSPAQFFADNQNIAGFDNPGKALYTTIRELVENSLDACEAAKRLPDICVNVSEYSDSGFLELRGMHAGSLEAAKAEAEAALEDDLFMSQSESTATKKASGAKDKVYYKIGCTDNGVGMAHDDIPNMLGRVLAGSKYGVRQTRGKFGLGAKMALIWSRKSTGMPIEVKSAHTPRDKPASHVTYCKLDIDIHRNRPRVIEHTRTKNHENLVGTTIELFSAGNWASYKSRVVQYMQQLAIITPYAEFTVNFDSLKSPGKSFSLKFARRSTKMPPPAKEVKHHPASVNDLLLRQLLERTPDTAVLKGLTTHLSALSTAVAGKVLEAAGVDPDQTGGSLSANEIHAIVRTLQRTKLHAPDGSCLSPAGEYNLTLGILKELAPDFVATHTEPAGAYDGHPFIVEAGIALGGTKAQEGITVHRYANRIPLLFEAGADVVTRTAMKRIRWSNYKIDQKKDKITVFVSLVSTKIPFKGTGKEYIGDDITEIADVVKKALMSCGAQLRSKLNIRASHRERDQKRKALLKYVPDVTRALAGIMENSRKRKAEFMDGVETACRRQPAQLARKAKAEDFFSPAALEAALRLTVDSMQSEAVDERDEAQKAATRCILASGIFDDPQAKRIKAPNGLYIMAVFQE